MTEAGEILVFGRVSSVSSLSSFPTELYFNQISMMPDFVT